MRLDRALPIMQAVADDPSGTHLTTSPESPSSRPDHADLLDA
jgi:hypothetical protein